MAFPVAEIKITKILKIFARVDCTSGWSIPNKRYDDISVKYTLAAACGMYCGVPILNIDI
jgi:hypothetical protein